jgi:hypothetical protein
MPKIYLFSCSIGLSVAVDITLHAEDARRKLISHDDGALVQGGCVTVQRKLAKDALAG